MQYITTHISGRTLFIQDNLAIPYPVSESVDLIAVTPPLNKARDFHATPDSLTFGALF